MDNLVIRPARAEDLDEVLRINEESVHFLSPLTSERLDHLHGECKMHLVAVDGEKVLAFCLVFQEGADYDSINYLWFRNHYKQFLYIDRLVVDIRERKRGLGEALYKEVFARSKEWGIPIITAEIDIAPPNPISLEFHKKFGFREVGRQEVAAGKKIVSLQVAEID